MKILTILNFILGAVIFLLPTEVFAQVLCLKNDAMTLNNVEFINCDSCHNYKFYMYKQALGKRYKVKKDFRKNIQDISFRKIGIILETNISKKSSNIDSIYVFNFRFEINKIDDFTILGKKIDGKTTSNNILSDSLLYSYLAFKDSNNETSIILNLNSWGILLDFNGVTERLERVHINYIYGLKLE